MDGAAAGEVEAEVEGNEEEEEAGCRGGTLLEL